MNKIYAKVVLASIINKDVDHSFPIGFLKEENDLDEKLLRLSNEVKEEEGVKNLNYQLIKEPFSCCSLDKMKEKIHAELNKTNEPSQESNENLIGDCFEVMINFYQESSFSFGINMGVIKSDKPIEEIKSILNQADLEEQMIEISVEKIEILSEDQIKEKVKEIIF